MEVYMYSLVIWMYTESLLLQYDVILGLWSQKLNKTY